MKKKKSSNKKQNPRSKICRPLLPREPYTWLLLIFDGHDNVRERHVFYSVTEDCYYVRFVPELRNKYVICSLPGGWMVLMNKSTYHCSILNISTMEKLQLPSLYSFLLPDGYFFPPACILSSHIMDGSCRIVFFDRFLRKFRSCYLGDTEFTEQELTYYDEDGGPIINFINFRGKLYAFACFSFNLMVSDFSDPGLHFEQVVSGESLKQIIDCGRNHAEEKYLVESCGDLLLIVIDGGVEDKISNVGIFRADFSIGVWVEHKTSLGDRAIFLDSVNTFSSPASAFGLKSNALYWIRRVPFGCRRPITRHLYMYDLEDQSVSVSLPCPIVGTISPLSWLSLPITLCDEETPEEKKSRRRSLLFETTSTVETNFNLQQQKKNTNCQIEKLRKTKNKEEIIETESSLWAYLPDDLLTEILARLFAGDRATFHSVCRSWYSVSLPSMTSKQQLIRPLMESSPADSFSPPFLMHPGNKACHPIYGELYSLDYFADIPVAKVRAARDGWLLMEEVLHEVITWDLFFYNPFTKSKITVPDSDAWIYELLYFSAPPTSVDFLVVGVAYMLDESLSICSMNSIDEGWEGWAYRDISPYRDYFRCSHCKAFVHKGLYYFLVKCAQLLVFDPKKDQIRLIEAPELISHQVIKFEFELEQYMLETDDGMLISVFVCSYGNFVYTFEWNVSTSKWEILQSLGNRMLFVSDNLSLCKRATVSGTGNNIYFPRVAGDSGNILFYSLATRKYHTFEMGTTYPNFLGSKFYPHYNGWFMP